jgi:hypothetical protein
MPGVVSQNNATAADPGWIYNKDDEMTLSVPAAGRDVHRVQRMVRRTGP